MYDTGLNVSVSELVIKTILLIAVTVMLSIRNFPGVIGFEHEY